MDADAADYIERIEDDLGMLVAGAVKQAIARFVIACKADDTPNPGQTNWDALAAGASSFLVGWPSCLGCFHQLTGPQKSTNFNFSDNDYDVSLGLKGDGLTKYLDTGLSVNHFSRMNASLSAFTTEPEGNTDETLMGFIPGGANRFRLRSNSELSKALFVNVSTTVTVPEKKAGFIGASRHNEASSEAWYGGIRYSTNSPASAIEFTSSPLRVFRPHTGSTGYTTARIAWYHYGEAVNLLSLSRRLKQFMREVSGNVKGGFPLSRMVN